MTLIRTSLLLSFLMMATGPEAQSAPATEFPDWLAGHWCARDGGGVEEHWLPAAGGLMLGLNRSVHAGRRTTFEFLRIEPVDGVLSYIALPQGKSATAFARTDGGSAWVRFENPAHDFPQLIEYRRKGDQLRAEIAGPGENGKEMRMAFEFSRCPG